MEFGNVFSGLARKQKITDSEMIRALRICLASEYEAAQLYQQLAESITDKTAIKVLTDIANEELIHVGEFHRLIHELSPDDEKYCKLGMKEVERIL